MASYQKTGIEAFTLTAQQAEKYQAFKVTAWLPIQNVCLAKKGMGIQNQSDDTLNAV